MPDDVPFYVNPGSVRSPEELAEYLQRNQGVPPDIASDNGPIAKTWERLAFPVASVAVGGIVRFRQRLLLVDDGHWQDSQLTVPGTTVRARETRKRALQRVFSEKLGIDAQSVSPLRTSFMIDDSGYGKPVNNLVFDDRLIELSGERVQPQGGLTHYWVSTEETRALIASGQVEPNAAALLTDYLSAV